MAQRFDHEDWESYARVYDSLNALRPYSRMLGDVVRLLDETSLPLLAAGCGTGNLLARLPKPWDERITGLDASRTMLERAATKCAARFLCTDLDHRLPLRHAAFETVVCLNTLYALRRPARTLREFSRVLRPGGRILVVTPKPGYENGLILKAHCRSPKPDSYWTNLHKNAKREAALILEAVAQPDLARRLISVARWNRAIAAETSFHFFSRSELAELARQSGFKVVRISSTYAGQNHLLVACKT